jgi:hypothetical protein
VYYLAPLVSDGPRHRVAAGAESARQGAVYLRDHALLYAPDGPGDRRMIPIADDPGAAMARSTRRALASVLGEGSRTVTEQIVSALRPRLRPSIRQIGGQWIARREIWLGDLAWSEPAVFVPHSKTFTDSFDAAIADTLNSKALDGGTGTWTNIRDNTARSWQGGTGAATQVLVAFASIGIAVTPECDTDDQYAEVEIVTIPSLICELHVSARNTAGDTGDTFLDHGYGARVHRHPTDSSSDFTDLQRHSDGTRLGSPVSGAQTSGTLRVECNGSSISMLQAGVVTVGPITDTTESTGTGFRSVAFWSYGGNTGDQTMAVDNFKGGDLTTAPAFQPAWARGANTILQ